MFLGIEDLMVLTGYSRPSAQRRWLAQNGFRFWVRGDGTLAVPSFQLEAAPRRRPAWQPDLLAMDLKR
jgi:hypothetical protein